MTEGHRESRGGAYLEEDSQYEQGDDVIRAVPSQWPVLQLEGFLAAECAHPYDEEYVEDG